MKTSITQIEGIAGFIQAHSKNYKKRSNRDVIYIPVHYTGNEKKDTAKNNATYYSRADSRTASAHIFVDDYEIWQSVAIKDIAYAVGTKGKYRHPKCRNENSVSVEMCCTAGNYRVSEATKNKAAGVVAYLCIMLGYSADQVDTYVIRHWDVTGKACPAQMVGVNNAEWLAFKDLVRQKIVAATVPQQPALPQIDITPVFNVAFYRSKYSDLAPFDDTTLTKHFWEHGMNEFRQASKNFNPVVYKEKNPDLQPFIEMTFKPEEWNMQYYMHYIQYGRFEGRVSA